MNLLWYDEVYVFPNFIYTASIIIVEAKPL